MYDEDIVLVLLTAILAGGLHYLGTQGAQPVDRETWISHAKKKVSMGHFPV